MNETNAINWKQVHEGLRASEQKLHDAFAPKGETLNRILEERAARFANFRKGGEREPVESLLVVQSGAERVAVNALAISEVFKINHLVPVPGSALELVGITTLRGTLYSVLNPAALLHQSVVSSENVSWGVVLRHASLHLALGVEKIHGLETVSAALLAAAEDNVVRIGQEVAILLDLRPLYDRLETQNASLSH